MSAKPSVPFSGYLPHMPRPRRRIRQLFLGKAEGMSVVGSGSAAFLVTRHFQLCFGCDSLHGLVLRFLGLSGGPCSQSRGERAGGLGIHQRLRKPPPSVANLVSAALQGPGQVMWPKPVPVELGNATRATGRHVAAGGDARPPPRAGPSLGDPTGGASTHVAAPQVPAAPTPRLGARRGLLCSGSTVACSEVLELETQGRRTDAEGSVWCPGFASRDVPRVALRTRRWGSCPRACARGWG